MTRRELLKDVEAEVEVDEEARDLRRRAKEAIASATFFFFSKRLRERRVGRSLCMDMHGIRSRYLWGGARQGANGPSHRKAEHSRANLLYVRV